MKFCSIVTGILSCSVVAAFNSQCGPASQTRTRAVTPWPPSRSSVLPSSSPTCLFSDMEPLAMEGEWQAYLDEQTTGLIYYFNIRTGESLWEPPTSSFPRIKLPRRKQRLAETLRTEYRNARQAELSGGPPVEVKQEEAESAEESKSWIGGLFEGQDEPEVEEEKQDGWLSGVFKGDTKNEIATEEPPMADTVYEEPAAVEEPVVEEQKPRGIFDAFSVKPSVEKAAVEEPVVEPSVEPVVDEPIVEEKPRPNIFNVFGTKPAVEKKPDEAVVEPAVEDTPKKAEGPSFLGNLMSFAQNGVKEKPSAVPKEDVIPKEEPNKTAVKKVRQRRTLLIPQPKFVNPKLITPKEVVPKRTMKIPPKELPSKPTKIDTSAYVLPHPAKWRWGGEDAVFSKGRTFGVFDGVTGAEKLDGVPLYSKTLASRMKASVGADGLSIQDMSKKLTEAAEYADSSATGASTALVASINEDGFLRVLNLGDSCCIVVRDGKVKAKSREISHYFECPYQLAEDSPDRPKDGTKLNVELLAGDMVIAGSDGIFDNLSDDQILELVDGIPMRSSLIAKVIVDASRKASLNTSAETPYAKLAKRRGDAAYADGLGGKLDDSSCVVAICK